MFSLLVVDEWMNGWAWTAGLTSTSDIVVGLQTRLVIVFKETESVFVLDLTIETT
jgi:hypothetical protein